MSYHSRFFLFEILDFVTHLNLEQHISLSPLWNCMFPFWIEQNTVDFRSEYYIYLENRYQVIPPISPAAQAALHFLLINNLLKTRRFLRHSEVWMVLHLTRQTNTLEISPNKKQIREIQKPCTCVFWSWKCAGLGYWPTTTNVVYLRKTIQQNGCLCILFRVCFYLI